MIPGWSDLTEAEKDAVMVLARTMTLSEAIKKCKEPCPQCGSEPGECADEAANLLKSLGK